jgi:hypothetical protein
MQKAESFVVQLVSVVVKEHGEARLSFACNKNDFIRLDELRSLETPLVIWLKEAPSDKINGTIISIAGSVNGRYPRKFVFETPESEKVRVGELSTLTGSELNLEIAILADPLPIA